MKSFGKQFLLRPQGWTEVDLVFHTLLHKNKINDTIRGAPKNCSANWSAPISWIWKDLSIFTWEADLIYLQTGLKFSHCLFLVCCEHFLMSSSNKFLLFRGYCSVFFSKIRLDHWIDYDLKTPKPAGLQDFSTDHLAAACLKYEAGVLAQTKNK